MADDLHARYMAAAATWRAHRTGCKPCQRGALCKDGAPLAERFTRLQDVYLNRRRST